MQKQSTSKKSKKRFKRLYVNDKQHELFGSKAATNIGIWGRGTGKSVTIGLIEKDAAINLPRGKRFLCAPTYKQILTNILPSVKKTWEMTGLKQDRHYVVGKRPPTWYRRPYDSPDSYENIISFYWGSCIQLISLDRSDTQRGGSFDGGSFDEMALLDREKVNKVVLPSIRGNRNKFSHWRHQQVFGLSSMPWKPEGQYILDYREKAIAEPDKFFYSEANVYDNIVVLGESGIDRMRANMTEMEFQVEVLNQRLTKMPDGYYPSLDLKHHTYTPTYTYEVSNTGIHYTGVKSVDVDEPIDLTFDFGGWFNCCIAFQEKDNIAYAMNCFFVKDQDKVDVLVGQFCKTYAGHRNKHVRIYGEPRGLDRQAIAESIYAVVAKQLQMMGWTVEICVQPVTDRHDLRHDFMDDVLKENDNDLPSLRVEEEQCKNLLLAMAMTGIKPDYKKDKSSERNRAYKQEHATHFTDALDYYFMQKYYYRVDYTLDDVDDWLFT